MAAGVRVIGALAALMTRARTGRGQLVETSHQEVIAALHQFSLLRYTHTGSILNRMGNRYSGPGTPIGAYECADGWIGLAISQSDQMERLLEVTGLITLLDHEEVDTIYDVMTNQELLDSHLIPYLKTQPRDDLVDLFQALRLPVAPISDIDDLLEDPHFEERDFWNETTDGVKSPGPPFRLSHHKWELGPKKRSGMFASSDEPVTHLADGPLTGLRVLDMTRVWAGPLAARVLADLGAEVLMTEVLDPHLLKFPKVTSTQLISFQMTTQVNDLGTAPVSITSTQITRCRPLSVRQPAGRDFFVRMLPKVDVVIETTRSHAELWTRRN